MRVMEAAWRTGGAVPGLLPPKPFSAFHGAAGCSKRRPGATLRHSDPQCFHLCAALGAGEGHTRGFEGTDESSVVRRAGIRSWLWRIAENIKITDRSIWKSPRASSRGWRERREQCETSEKTKCYASVTVLTTIVGAGRRLVLGGWNPL